MIVEGVLAGRDAVAGLGVLQAEYLPPEAGQRLVAGILE